MEPICEERITFPSGSLTLSGVLSYPEQASPLYAVLLCAPHPNFAGNMENNVIQALSREFGSQAMTLRFDYRGIGASEIELPSEVSAFDYWTDIEESKNYTDPLADVCAAARALKDSAVDLPLAVVGYSFGAIIGLLGEKSYSSVSALVGIAPPLKRYPFTFLSDCLTPCLLLSGRDDFVFDESAAEKSAWPACVTQKVLEGHDHFFRETESVVTAHARAFVGSAMKLN